LGGDPSVAWPGDGQESRWGVCSTRQWDRAPWAQAALVQTAPTAMAAAMQHDGLLELGLLVGEGLAALPRSGGAAG